MIAFINKRRATFALLLWFIIVFLIAYYLPGRTDSKLTRGLTVESARATRKHPAIPAPTNSLSNDAGHLLNVASEY
jgi:hypothetical protein